MSDINLNHIRNFCIIAHIDHGKSTLADRMLELTGVVEGRQMRDRFLDKMELEREKGITIKLKAIRLPYTTTDGQQYFLNLIDTPGHVDFSYEVSRSLAACEGALLLVDAAQGVQAQTLANAYKALEQGLTLIPVVNKIDAAAANPEGVARELCAQLGFDLSDVIYTSGRTGEGVSNLLETIVKKIPHPSKPLNNSLKALIFDSLYDQHQGVVAFVRIISGQLRRGEQITLLATKTKSQVDQVGYVGSDWVATDCLSTGEVGFIHTGLKDLSLVTAGDTITHVGQEVEPLPGYTPAQPMVFAGFYPANEELFDTLKEALERIGLEDASLTFSRESAAGLGRGFRCGFLGTLHLEIIKERLSREFDVELIITAPSVRYQVVTGQSDNTTFIDRPQDLPDQYQEIREPWVKGEILVPEEYLGEVMKFCEKARGKLQNVSYLKGVGNVKRVRLSYEFPLAELLLGFYDGLKSASSGYASFDYQIADYRTTDAVKLKILVHDELVGPLSQIVLRERAGKIGRQVLTKLKELLPRQQFAVALQAAVGGKIVARETISARRKDVTAKLYGGDRTRKDKLLKKQKKGKAKLRQFGQVSIPSEVFYKVLSSSS